jgi:oxaloacetate decarboxylase alpha subunit
MITIFEEMPYHANLDREALRKICKYFQDLAPTRRQGQHQPNIIDPDVLMHHIPGGMISNLRSQLEQQGALAKINEVLQELPQVKEDLGHPPLVTPTSQILGVQAVMNVLTGERYSMVPQETKNYVKGLYGRAPGHIDPVIKQKILGKEKAITCRPADLLEPMLPNITKDIEPGLIKEEEDIISYCLFPEQALDYFKWRKLPEKERPTTPADAELQQKKEVTTETTVPPSKPLLAPGDYREIHALIEKIKELHFTEVTIRRDDINLSLKSPSRAAHAAGAHHAARHPAETGPAAKEPAPAGITVSVSPTPPSSSTPASPAVSTAPVPAPTPQPQVAAPAAPVSGPTIDAPLNGTFYTTEGPGKPKFVKEGDEVKVDSPVCIVEAMKMFNQIKAPCNCRIIKVLVEHGKPVQKGQPLMAIEKL